MTSRFSQLGPEFDNFLFAPVTSVKVVEIGVEFEVAIGQAAKGGSLAGLGVDRRRCKFGHSLDLHVAALEQPLVVLLEQDGADQPGDAGLVGEDADDVGAPFDFLVQALQRVGGVQFGAVLGREGPCRPSTSCSLSSISAASLGQRGRS